MPGLGGGAGPLAHGQAVVDVLPVVWCGIGRIDAERLDGVDGLKHFLDFGPSGDAQQTFAAGTHMRHDDVALARRDRAQDVYARYGGSVIVPGPADESEDAAGLK